MQVTIFITMKFRVDIDTEVSDYVHDTFEVDDVFSQEQQIIARVDALVLVLNKIMASKIRAVAVA